MYIPKIYNSKDDTEAIEFIRTFNFGMLISVIGCRPVGTHVPFVVYRREKDIVLNAHLALANTQWKDFERQECLAVFSEPHAYISPGHYDKQQNVPTWNYASVHVYGKPRILHSEAEKMNALDQMIDMVEPSYKKQWDEQSEKYRKGMVKGIVVFEMIIDEIQYAKKLSQDKKPVEQERIKKSLKESNNSVERLIGNMMDD